MPSDCKKFYVTTPIYYVNARPHIGHAYTTIVADVLARRHRLLGEEVFFLTGTDEHGQKIERSAAKAGVAPQAFTDQVSAEFENLWKRMGITNDKFIRTTSPEHARGVQKLFRRLYERGHIYLAQYTGAYCVSDEAFVDAPVGTPCPDCGRLLEEVTEENFFFKLSAFGDRIIALIESGQLAVEPESRRNEVLSFVRGGLKDLSISRSSFTWGIPVPADVQEAAGAKQPHVVYVWLDALANYMTAVGYGDDAAQAEFEKWWPADLHLVGKEIIRFHCVYWPAFLLAAELPLPKAITAHGWLLFDNSKMSKSKGNIVRTETILEAFGTLCPPPSTSLSNPTSTSTSDDVILTLSPSEGKDLLSSEARRITPESGDRKGVASAIPPNATPNPASAAEVRPDISTESNPSPHDRDLFAADVLRYFLLREIPFGQDGSFSFEALITRYNADLANGYGNLVSRVLKMISTYNSGELRAEDRNDWNERNFFEYAFGESPDATAWSGMGDPRPVLRSNTMYHVLVHTLRTRDLMAGEFGTVGFQAQLGEVALAVSVVDSYISFEKPWKMEEGTKRDEVLYTAAESIRIITALLHPILPYATARVWQQLGLGDIEEASKRGELKNLEWGGLKPGTKLGTLGPIFPRADKGLAQIMADIEERDSSPSTSARPEAPLKSALTPAPAAPVPASSTDPGAPPRAFEAPAEASGVLPVAGSAALTTERQPVTHTDATPSGAFASVASQTPITAMPTDASPQITIDDFAKVELRVAQVTLAERIPKADKLLRLEVSLGDALPRRQILSGIAEWYAPEDLVGRRIIVITNLAPRKMRGLESHGMLLAASEEGGKPFLATVPEGVAVGTRLK